MPLEEHYFQPLWTLTGPGHLLPGYIFIVPTPERIIGTQFLGRIVPIRIGAVRVIVSLCEGTDAINLQKI